MEMFCKICKKQLIEPKAEIGNDYFCSMKCFKISSIIISMDDMKILHFKNIKKIESLEKENNRSNKLISMIKYISVNKKIPSTREWKRVLL